VLGAFTNRKERPGRKNRAIGHVAHLPEPALSPGYRDLTGSRFTPECPANAFSRIGQGAIWVAVQCRTVPFTEIHRTAAAPIHQAMAGVLQQARRAEQQHLADQDGQ